jgi:hypothetical protein
MAGRIESGEGDQEQGYDDSAFEVAARGREGDEKQQP